MNYFRQEQSNLNNIEKLSKEVVNVSINNKDFIEARDNFLRTKNINFLFPVLSDCFDKNKLLFVNIVDEMFSEEELKKYKTQIKKENRNGKETKIIPLYEIDKEGEKDIKRDLIDKVLKLMVFSKDRIFSEITSERPYYKQKEINFQE